MCRDVAPTKLDEARFEFPTFGQDSICRVAAVPTATILLPEMKLEFRDRSREIGDVPAGGRPWPDLADMLDQFDSEQ